MFLWFVCCLVVARLISASDERCSKPPQVDNSIFIAMKEEGQISGIYSCIKGYHLVGKGTLFCNAFDEWTVPTATCHLGHCPNPVLSNGKFNYSWPVKVSDKVTFMCNDYYILKGSSWSQCLENHTWAPPFPICKSRDCDPPENPAHGYFKGRNFTSGSNITYYCEEGYRLMGTPDQQCIDGEWNSDLPSCELIQEAPKPTAPTKYGKALLAFQENKDLCKAIQDFIKRLTETGLTMEELKHTLEMKKAELKGKKCCPNIVAKKTGHRDTLKNKFSSWF